MKILHVCELRLPSDFVFERASDFAAFEKRAMRAGIEVHRQTGGPITPGARWQIAGIVRGKPRAAEIELTELTRPDRIGLVGKSGGLRIAATVSFIMMTGRASRIETEIEAKATTLRSRLLLQSTVLVRKRIARRIRSAIDQAARRLEADYYG